MGEVKFVVVVENVKVLEGTWEEILARASEFAGCRVRLSVMPAANGVATNEIASHEESLVEAFARVGTIDGPPLDVAADGDRLWGAYLLEKHHKGTL